MRLRARKIAPVVPPQKSSQTMLFESTAKSIYLYGGYNNATDEPTDSHVKSGTVHRYNIESNQWFLENEPQAPWQTRVGHVCCLYKQKMIVYGGLSSVDIGKQICCYDLIQKLWTCHDLKGQFLVNRYYHRAVLKNSIMYIYAGYSDHCLNDMFCINLETFDCWQLPKASGAPEPRCGHTFALCEADATKAYVFGGYQSQTESYLSDVHEYHFGSNSWTCVIAQEANQQGTTTTTSADDENGDTSALERLFNADPETKPIGRVYHGWAPTMDGFIIYGGVTKIGGYTVLNDCWLYNGYQRQWIMISLNCGSSPVARDSCAAVLVGLQLFVYGGETSEEVLLNEMLQIDLEIQRLLAPADAGLRLQKCTAFNDIQFQLYHK